MEVTVAFDGAERPAVQPAMPRGIRVLFSAAGEIADDLIRRLVDAEPPGRPVVVVSSDQQVATDVRAAGAWSAPATALLALL
jgi:predicted RNA-binding protein with PIN domain